MGMTSEPKVGSGRDRRGPALALVVNADDFGLTRGVSDAILAAHRAGTVSSTSALVVARDFESSAPRLADAPRLGVGVHLALVGEDPPLLTAREVPTLVDKSGRLPRSWRAFVPRAARGQVDADDVRRELSAQLDAFVACGLTPTHLDTHQHVHLWPSVATVVVELARERAVPVVRAPDAHGRSPVALGVRALATRLRWRIDRAGLVRTDDFWGLERSGRLSPAVLGRLVDELVGRPDLGSAEVNVHPGVDEEPALRRHPWPGRSRQADLDALLSPPVKARLARPDVRLVSLADLAGRSTLDLRDPLGAD